MQRKIINFVKKNKWIYNLYFIFGTVFINFLKLIVPTDNKIILLNSFGGRKYDDSPKAIYEELINDKRFENYKFYWAFNEPRNYNIEKGKKIKMYSLQYFLVALKSKVWITNSSINSGIKFKGKKTLYLNTWHGTPIKKLGRDINKHNKSFKGKSKNDIDIMTVQGRYDAEIFSRAFNIKKNSFLYTGLPRNDELYHNTETNRQNILKDLNISQHKKIILYAPTYREDEQYLIKEKSLSPPIDFKKWEQFLGDEYIVLLRAHYETINNTYLDVDNEFVKDMSDYPSLNDLMIISDILISDYSSVFFDFAILDKPMICYTYDFNEYSKSRGMYFDIRDYVAGGSISEIELLSLIKKQLNSDLETNNNFKNNFVEFYGDATKNVVNYIYKKINHSMRKK